MEFIVTARLFLRRATGDEARSLLRGSAPAGVSLAPGYPTPDSPDAFAGLLEDPRRRGPWLIIRTADRSVIGDIGLDHTVGPGVVSGGYGLARSAWGQGYATEALRALVEHTWDDPSVRRIELDAESGNAASRRVMEKVGFWLLREDGDKVVYALDRPR